MARFDATDKPMKPSNLRQLRREFDESFERLVEAGIINEDGSPNFKSDDGD